MQTPLLHLRRLLLLVLAVSAGYAARAQVTYTPVKLTGFNHDIIANSTGAVSATTTVDIDGAVTTAGTGYCLMSQDYMGPTGQAPTNGTYPALENNGLFTSALNSAITFQLADYSANNTLRLYGAGASGTLSFNTPSPAAELYVIGTSGNAASVLTVTVNFADGTSQSFTNQTIADWFATGQTNVVREKLGRVSRGDNTVQYTSSPVGPRLYQLKLVLDAANVKKNITGITFNKAAAAGTTVLLAVTAGVYPVCSVAPTTQAQATTTSGGSTALTTACPSTSIYLSLTGAPAYSGYTYQWQSSPDNATWTSISGATSSTYTATQTAATYYRCLVYCLYDSSNGSTATPSGSVQVNQTPLNNCYCTPSASTGCGTYGIITSVSITGTTLSNSPGCISSGSPGYVSAYYANYATGGTPTATLTANTTYTITGTVGNGTRAVMWIDYNQNGVFESSEATQIALNSTTSAASYSTTFTVPLGALAGNTRMRIRSERNTATVLTQATSTAACNATVNGESLDYLITISSVACAGTPAAATLTASASAVCSGSSVTLTASGQAAGTTGLSYQFQSSPASAGTFANLGSAQTSTLYTVSSQTAATDYRVIVTCTSSNLSMVSNVVSVAQSPYYNCYCTPGSNGTNEYITSITLPGTNGFTSTSNATPDQTVPNGNAAGYSDYTSNSALTTTLNQGATYNGGIGLTVRSNAANSTGGLWIDYDHSGTFDASEFTAIGTSSATSSLVSFTATLAVPATALTGSTRVRVRWRNAAFTGTAAEACATGWSGEVEDYLITIAAPANCAAPPSSVTASANVANACANGSFTLSASGISTTISGYTYQWQSSPAGAGTFSNISGATTQNYTVSGQTAATDYQLVVGCQYGGSPVTSNVVSVGQNSFTQCYCAPAYTNGCGSYGQIANVQLNTLNYSAGCAASPYYTVVPAGTATTTVNGGSSYTLKITNAGTASTFGVWIDYNQDGTFSSSEFVYGATGSTSGVSTSITIPTTAKGGATRMRVRTDSYTAFTSASSPCSTLNYGEADDFTITIVAPTACAGAPPMASASTSGAASVCQGTSFTLTGTYSGNISGLTYQWQSSPAGAGTFGSISGATALTYTVSSQTAATDYRLLVTCTASAQSSVSNVVSVGQNSFLACYCTPTGGACGNEYIQSVTLNTLSNAGTGCTGSGYTDYTGNSALTTTLNQGITYTLGLSLVTNSSPAGAGVWIDYDHSGTFDASEYTQLYSYTGANVSQSVTSSTAVAIPATSLLGATRMRVRSANSSVQVSATTACPPNPYYGEVEDYLVTIAGPAADLVISTTGQTVPAGGYNSITVQSGGVGTLAGNVTVQNGVTVQSGGVLNDGCAIIGGAGPFTLAAGGTLGICQAAGISSSGATGAVQVTGTRSFSTDALYTYNGTAAQVTGPGLPATVRTLTLSNSTGLSLTGAVTTTTGTTLTSGVLTTGTSALTLAAGAALTETSTGYAVGTVQTTRSLSTAGASESFGGLGLTLTPSGSTLPGNTLVRRVTGTALSGQGTSTSVKRYFDIQPATTTGLNVALDLTARDDERNGIAPANLRLFKSDDNGVTWRQQLAATFSATAASGSQPATYTASLSGITNFSLWTLGDAVNPLPVQLVSFTAAAEGVAVRLNWTTASELNSSRFEVERSPDGTGFGRIGTVAAAGSSTSARAYSLTDGNLPTGTSMLYYRLRQVDRDGTAAYSAVRAVPVAASGLVLLPNPTHEQTTLTGAEAGAAVLVLDALGRTVLTTQADNAGQAQLQLPQGLASGLYLVRAGRQTVRLVLE